MLFERDNKKVSLSPYGKDFLPYAMHAYNTLQNGTTKITRSKTALFGSVKISSVTSIRCTKLPEYLYEFYQDEDRKNIIIELVPTLNTSEAISNLQNGICDLLVTHPVNKDMTSHFLFQQELVLALPDSHRLAAQESLSFADIENEPFIVGSQGGYLRKRLYEIFAYSNSNPNIILSTDDIWTQLTYVSIGLGIAILPYIPCDTFHVVYRHISHPQFSYPVFLSYLAGEELRPEVQSVVDFFINYRSPTPAITI